MDNLIERLQTYQHEEFLAGAWWKSKLIPINPDGPEAADRITSQSAEIARLTEVLASISARYSNGADAATLVWIARNALATKRDAKP